MALAPKSEEAARLSENASHLRALARLALAGVLIMACSCSKRANRAASSEQAPTALNNNASQSSSDTYGWTAGQEGSFVHVSKLHNRTSSIVRCWPNNGEFDCLWVSDKSALVEELIEPPSQYDLVRTFSKKLPSGWADVKLNGYTCSTDGYTSTESIDRDGEPLTSQNASMAFWSKNEVKKLIEKNQLHDALYFNCEKLTDLLHRGSIESLNSTLMKHSML